MPSDARPGYMRTADGVRLRYAIFPRAFGSHRGTICLVQGRTEYIEKYFETIEDFRRRGFAVATFDWRGQGGSDRLIGNARNGYVDTFDDYATDLASFHQSVLLPDCPPPFHLVGHSMGGLVSLLAGAQDRMMFERIFLSAPMLALPGMGRRAPLWSAVAETASFLGLGAAALRRRADRAPAESGFVDNPLTGDRRRYLRMVETLATHPQLLIGSPTYRWIAAALKAMQGVADPGFAARIKVPILILAAARDIVVSTPAIEELGLRMRMGRHLVIPTARHELYMETDSIRAQVLAAFDAFVTDATT